MTARQRLEQALADHGCTVRGNSAQCPAHEDRTPSLSIGDRADGRGVVISCKGGDGCDRDAILGALGLTVRDLYDEPLQREDRRQVVAEYVYTDEHGAELFRSVRYQPKDFRQYHTVNGRQVWNMQGVRRVLYRLPAVIEAAANGGTVYVVEGEKDVHAIEAAGAVATTSPMGAKKWRDEYAGYLAGAEVVVVADRDEPGRAHAAAVAASLRGKAKSVRVVEAVTGKDAADHLGAGHTLGDFQEAAEDVPHAELETIVQTCRALDRFERYVPVDWAAAWKRQPESVEWLIEPFIEVATVNVLFAKAGTGKSLLALEWALTLVRRGRTVVYVDDENRVTDIVERLQAMGAEPGELDRLLFYSFAGLPPLDTALGGEHLLGLADGAALVVVDTTMRMVAGGENDSDTFLGLYKHTMRPLKARGITVLRLDHPGKSDEKGQRGSSSKGDDVDTVWRLSEVSGGRKYRMHRDKNRAGHAPDARDVEIERRYAPLKHVWTVPDGDVKTSLVGQLAGQLDDLGIPPSAGRDRCRTALNEAGIPISNALLSDVVRYRKTAPDSYGTVGQLVPALASVPVPTTPEGSGHGTDSAHRAEDWPEGSIGEAANA